MGDPTDTLDLALAYRHQGVVNGRRVLIQTRDELTCLNKHRMRGRRLHVHGGLAECTECNSMSLIAGVVDLGDGVKRYLNIEVKAEDLERWEKEVGFTSVTKKLAVLGLVR